MVVLQGVLIRVLFIGNSLTYVNDLPGTLAALARSGGDSLMVRAVAEPDLAVIDHVAGQSNALRVIREQAWDYVILQQGPTSQPLYRDTLILATRRIDSLVRTAGGVTAQYMTWPSSGRPQLFEAVRTSSRLAAEAVGGLFIPAGEAWRVALEEDAALPLYGPDGFHPAPLGTYLVALVMYEALTGHDARSLPGRAVVAGRTLAAEEATVRRLQRIAHETVAAFAEGPIGRSSRPPVKPFR